MGEREANLVISDKLGEELLRMQKSACRILDERDAAFSARDAAEMALDNARAELKRVSEELRRERNETHEALDKAGVQAGGLSAAARIGLLVKERDNALQSAEGLQGIISRVWDVIPDHSAHPLYLVDRVRHLVEERKELRESLATQREATEEIVHERDAVIKELNEVTVERSQALKHARQADDELVAVRGELYDVRKERDKARRERDDARDRVNRYAIERDEAREHVRALTTHQDALTAERNEAHDTLDVAGVPRDGAGAALSLRERIRSLAERVTRNAKSWGELWAKAERERAEARAERDAARAARDEAQAQSTRDLEAKRVAEREAKASTLLTQEYMTLLCDLDEALDHAGIPSGRLIDRVRELGEMAARGVPACNLPRTETCFYRGEQK